MSQKFTIINTGNWDGEFIHVTEEGREGEIVKLAPGEQHDFHKQVGAFSKRLVVDFEEAARSKPFYNEAGDRQLVPEAGCTWVEVPRPEKAAEATTTWDNLAGEPEIK